MKILIIAYSTTSQLGYLVAACGINIHHVSLFHLVNHAFFKALLFLAAGAIIHALVDRQDLRRMGGLVLLLPLTYTLLLLGSLSLLAFPFFTGFYSKELILAAAASASASANASGICLIYLLALAAAILTITYCKEETVSLWLT